MPDDAPVMTIERKTFTVRRGEPWWTITRACDSRHHFHNRRHGSFAGRTTELTLPSTLLTTIGLLLCATGVVLQLPHLYLIAVHVRRGRHELARERQRVAAQATALADTGKPLVCVQLPVHNEPSHVAAAIDCLCALDWPRDRLEIMVLDDSTDDTSILAAERVAFWHAAGIPIVHVRRDERREFKAGALQDGLARTRAEYIAIFDADYRPERTFVLEAMGALLADPRAAFVQARTESRNRERNWLTRAQALGADSWSAYEQAARTWAGVPISFNGTCGIWRRQAIDEAGGWSGRSLVEDHDLSLRAFAAGWWFTNLSSVVVAGELPETFAVLWTQRARWGAGIAQVTRTMPRRIVQQLGLPQAAVFLIGGLSNTVFPLVVLITSALALAAWLIGADAAPLVSLGLLGVVALYLVLRAVGAALATRLLGRRLGLAFALDLTYLLLMDLALAAGVARATVRGLLRRELAFVRTPKVGR